MGISRGMKGSGDMGEVAEKRTFKYRSAMDELVQISFSIIYHSLSDLP